jgi:hypothetical protein
MKGFVYRRIEFTLEKVELKSNVFQYFDIVIGILKAGFCSGHF